MSELELVDVAYKNYVDIAVDLTLEFLCGLRA
jgi:hypothetical protein